MMDSATEELLSRHLDDDLPTVEAAELEQRFVEEPDLKEAFDRLAALRGAVSSLADSMEPPAELDSLMEPLRRAKPGPRGLRSAYGWLAAAATVVIGVSVALEVQRHNPEPSYEHVAASHPPPTQKPKGEYFQLQPLPSAVPGTELLGAADHLLAEPEPSPPPVAEPEPLHVMGPLSEEEVAEAVPLRSAEQAAAPRKLADEARQEMTFAPEPRDQIGDAAREGKAAEALRSRAAPVQGTLEGTRGTCVLVVRSGDQEIRVECTSDPSVAAGRYHVVLGLDRGGRVHSCRAPDENDRSVAAAVCSLVYGSHLAGLADAELSGEVVVGGL